MYHTGLDEQCSWILNPKRRKIEGTQNSEKFATDSKNKTIEMDGQRARETEDHGEYDVMDRDDKVAHLAMASFRRDV